MHATEFLRPEKSNLGSQYRTEPLREPSAENIVRARTGWVWNDQSNRPIRIRSVRLRKSQARNCSERLRAPKRVPAKEISLTP
jgi:hypothetical protein